MHIQNKESIWIGLVGVISSTNQGSVLENARGAYVNFLTWAKDYDSFVIALSESLKEYNLEYFEIEDVEPLQNRLKKYKVDPEIHEIANEVYETKKSRFTTFHTFKDVH